MVNGLFAFCCLQKVELKEYQTPLESQLMQFITSTTIKPTRLLRSIYSRIYVLLFDRGDTHNLFDIVTAVQAHLAKKTNHSDITWFTLFHIYNASSLLHLLGTLTSHYGSKITVLCAESFSLMIRIFNKAKPVEVSLIINFN